MRLISPALLVLSLFMASGIGSARATPMPAAFPGAAYVEVGAYLTRDADIETWYTALSRLRQNFDEICGDTFCEGDYSNIQSLSFRCSVEKNTGVIGRCVWILAASNEEISATDGRVLVDERHWRCRVPLARLTRVDDLLTALSGPTPLRAILPGTTKSIYDGLADCL